MLRCFPGATSQSQRSSSQLLVGGGGWGGGGKRLLPCTHVPGWWGQQGDLGHAGLTHSKYHLPLGGSHTCRQGTQRLRKNTLHEQIIYFTMKLRFFAQFVCCSLFNDESGGNILSALEA